MAKLKNTIKKIRNIAFVVIMVFLLAIIGISIYTRITNVQILPYSIIWVKTGSMEPKIPAQSYILVKYTDPKNINAGDIITFKSNDPNIYDELNTHRVVSVNEEHTLFRTKGDNNANEDKPDVPADRIVCKYVANLSIITFLGKAFTSIWGLVITSIIIVAGTAIYIALYVIKAKRQEYQQKIDELVKIEVEKLKQENNSKKEDKS